MYKFSAIEANFLVFNYFEQWMFVRLCGIEKEICVNSTTVTLNIFESQSLH